MKLEVRRIVTGEDEDGLSAVKVEGPAPRARVPNPESGFAALELWNIRGRPLSSTSGSEDPPEGVAELEPPPGGVSWRIVFIPPDAPGVEHVPGFERDERFDSSRPGMHRTDTVDLVQILEGEIDLVLEHSEVKLRAGDCIVQRGTSHAWRNRSGRPCVFSIVMLRSDAQEPIAQDSGQRVTP